jgi:hypothetical protein
MTHALTIPAMRATTIMRNVAAGGVGDTKTARVIMTAVIASMTGVRATMTEGMVASHAISIVVMMIDGTEPQNPRGG